MRGQYMHFIPKKVHQQININQVHIKKFANKKNIYTVHMLSCLIHVQIATSPSILLFQKTPLGAHFVILTLFITKSSFLIFRGVFLILILLSFFSYGYLSYTYRSRYSSLSSN